MRRSNFLRTLLLVSASVVIGAGSRHLHAQQPAEGQRVALLVGVESYQKSSFVDLAYAEDDVQAVAVELKKLGFRVQTLTGKNATRAAITSQVNALVKDLGKADTVLVMLSGHGQQIDVKTDDGTSLNDAFFCPYDGVDQDPETLFSLSYLTDEVLAKHVGKCLLLVDACRNNPDASRGRGIEGQYVRLPQNVSILFSCGQGQRSYESRELRHGLFTYCVLESLQGAAQNPGGSVEWVSVVADAQRRMGDDTILGYLPNGEKQVPTFAGQASFTLLGRSRDISKATAIFSEGPSKMAGTNGIGNVNELKAVDLIPKEATNRLRLGELSISALLEIRPQIRPKARRSRPTPDQFNQYRLSSSKVAPSEGWNVVDANNKDVRLFTDTNDDGFIDSWTYFDKGFQSYSEWDFDYDGIADDHEHYPDPRREKVSPIPPTPEETAIPSLGISVRQHRTGLIIVKLSDSSPLIEEATLNQTLLVSGGKYRLLEYMLIRGSTRTFHTVQDLELFLESFSENEEEVAPYLLLSNEKRFVRWQGRWQIDTIVKNALGVKAR